MNVLFQGFIAIVVILFVYGLCLMVVFRNESMAEVYYMMRNINCSNRMGEFWIYAYANR